MSPVANLLLRGRWSRYAAIDARVVADVENALLSTGKFVKEDVDFSRFE